MSIDLVRILGRAAFAAAIGFAVLTAGATSGARAADDDEPDLLDTKILRHIMKGLGFKRDEEAIDYRERSPLVLPPSKQLPSPESASPASKTAGWPDDPDVKAARQRKDIEKNRRTYVEGVDDRPLRPSEYSLPAGAGPRRPETASGGPGGSAEQAAAPSTLKELGSKGIFSQVWGAKEEYTTFTTEPPRSSLLEPPPGYRTPSPNQPFGVGKEKWIAPKVDRQEPVR